MAGDKVAMILAAGRGERMRPLTDHTPKPLLNVAGKRLIEYSLEALARAGCQRVIINCAHFAEMFPATLGNGESYGLSIQYSFEPEALETAGGILQALPLIDSEEFVVINGDVWCDAPLAGLFEHRLENHLAHLVMVDNPPQHPLGDFCLARGVLYPKPTPASHGLTYSGIGKYSRKMFDAITPGKRPLRPLLDAAMQEQRLTAEYYAGQWSDIGTPQRLDALANTLASNVLTDN